jgi:SAM-dependent methyltransferase
MRLRRQVNLVDQSDVEKYVNMQKRVYDATDVSPREIVGNYAYHENFPYETHLIYFNGDIRRPIFNDFSAKKAFDIGCGEGRMIRRMKNIFGEVDGCDLSHKMVTTARNSCTGTIYLTDGTNCGDAPSDYYDFAYCTISLQHICVHDVRESILRDVTRILRTDGKVTLQMTFSKHFPYVSIGQRTIVDGSLVDTMLFATRHASWFENKTDAQSTNSGCDVVIGTKDLEIVRQDLLQLFETIDFWFHDISIGRPERHKTDRRVLPAIHPNSHVSDSIVDTHWIFIHCTQPKK